MSISNAEISTSFDAWQEAHKKLIDAEKLLGKLSQDTPNEDRVVADERIHSLRMVSDDLLELAEALSLKQESESGDAPES